MRTLFPCATALVTLATLTGSAFAQDILPPKENYAASKAEYSPYAGDHFPNRVLFGDTHLHSSWSTDSGMAGGTLGQDAGYRVSRGEEVTSHLGWKVKLIRPLDFIVMADHAENLGLADFIRRSDPLVLANPVGKKWHDMVKSGNGYDAFLEWLRANDTDLINEPRMLATAWDSATSNADKYYQPGTFTTFHGFEWTSHPGGNNMHRVVIFRDGKDRTSQVMPYSQYDSTNPEDLWDYMAGYEDKTGGQVLAIPHNGNLSNGLMFAMETIDGNKLSGTAIDADYAAKRIKWEPLAEVTQQKGDGEAHPLLSPDDAFADFETLDAANLNGQQSKTPEMLPREYARAALKTGLKAKQDLGVNPFKFGMIGSTDNHTALPTSREENNFSKASFVEPSAERAFHPLVAAADPANSIMEADVGASGLAAVWARENTRESIWDAMARKETYATSGTRIRVRVFGGWDFEADEVVRPDFARTGYARGVPMGGDLKDAPNGEAPKFMIRAVRDPDGANLDRIQVVKGWLDANGETQEKIFDVACADREIVNNACDGDVGNTVDVADASYTNTIGDALLAAHWTDPEFDPSLSAFYYVRVLEIPTPRWTAYDAKFFGTKMPEGTAMQLQDRAYTSPIWYTPEG
ncbi:DUF3604 domain-containing protein [Roseibium alexandrii]|uniref:DUF3604 domain-containing protein n=1 Tax=Roseibium alexandrii TaxID=388408 RepID=A0A0M7AQC2_9HYPH|nr:DUF3604 domain-containing protein [Roseibium alexandrii]CTQ76711.1 hypothetical protein LAX5112_04683 [Roseibium alexandrii]